MHFFSVGTVALFLQIALMYWVTAINKSGEGWWNGNAVYYALSYDRGATELGSYLLNFPVLLTVMTFATLALEALGPFLLLSPVFNATLRTAGVAAFMGLHFGIMATLSVGLFSLYAALCMVCFLPALFWDRLVPRLRARIGWSADAARRAGRRAGHRDASPPAGAESFGFVGVGGAPANSSNFSRSSVQSGSSGRTMKTRPTVLRSSLLANLLALGFLLNMLGWNLASVTPLGMPTPAYQVSVLSGLSQGWFMFAPSPPKHDGWWVIPGELKGGQRVDLLPVIHNDYGMREVSYGKPEDIGATVENWQKYLNYMTTTEYVDTPQRRADQLEKRESFASYLCQQWNERHAGGESLEKLKIVYMRETTLPPGQTPEIEREVLHEQSCD